MPSKSTVTFYDEETNEAFEERAAIMEFCGHLPRAKAEALAREIVEREIPGKPSTPGSVNDHLNDIYKLLKRRRKT